MPTSDFNFEPKKPEPDIPEEIAEDSLAAQSGEEPEEEKQTYEPVESVEEQPAQEVHVFHAEKSPKPPTRPNPEPGASFSQLGGKSRYMSRDRDIRRIKNHGRID